MNSTQTVATFYTEQLRAAKDKRKASDDILYRMSKLRYKGHPETIPVAGKKKIIKLIQAQISGASIPATDRAKYARVITYMLKQVGSTGD